MGDRGDDERSSYRRNTGIFSPEYRKRRHDEKVGLE